MFLDGIARRPDIPEADRFPWTLPLFRDLAELRFEKPVTFLVVAASTSSTSRRRRYRRSACWR